ncbi:MAG: cytidylyltransferase family protein [Erysipelotrichaceae bacterium]|nr:MAG: cytidylyltransferase family [Erysipelotrichaceae bacterium]TXT19951.1 MAG: cytidylyltransferase family protein [Erysipelotrichaceae bacterium]
MNNLLGIVLSFVFVFMAIGISTVLNKKSILDDEGSRKFIHIAVSNWWILAMLTFDDPLWASFVPLMFVFINYISMKQRVFTAMERKSGKQEWGTVYYAISLLILAYVTFATDIAYIGGIGILIMGYGDGFAALIGTKYGKHRLWFGKSIEGASIVLGFGILIAGIFFYLYSPNLWLMKSIIVGIVAMVVELFSPNGFDNLSLPLTASLVSFLLTIL